MSEKAEPTAERYPRQNPSKNLEKHVLDPSNWITEKLVFEGIAAPLSSRTRFGICPASPLARNAGQMLKPSCSTREKRHREKRGFRLVPLLARAVQHDNFSSLRTAFTMAEILLSLTIIGVVAAITLPSLTGNINERTWNTQRKALYARFSQAIALMPALNGYGTLRESTDSAGSTSIEDTAAETFVTAGLAKVMKINNICDKDHLPDCGISLKYTNLQGAGNQNFPLTMGELNEAMLSAHQSDYDVHLSYSAIDTKAVAFETANGESIVVYYNPNCVANMSETWDYNGQPKMCANFIYDLNGTKGPNTVGKDIGVITAFYPSDSVVVAPVPFRTLVSGVTSANAASVCTSHTQDDYRIPTKEETFSVALNKKMFGFSTASSSLHLYTSSKFVRASGITSNWLVVTRVLQFRVPSATAGWTALCVKR